MKLIHPDFPYRIEFAENQVQTLVLENPKILSNYLAELFLQVDGGDGKWILSEKEKIFSIQKKCQIIIDPFCLDFNQRKLINTLYERIEKETLSTEILLEWNKLYPNMMNIVEKMINRFDYNLSYNDDIEIKDFLKLMNLKFEDKSDNLAEKLIDYMCLLNEVIGISLFVFVNIKSYLDEEETKHLFKQAFYKKIQILLIENCVRPLKYAGEKVTIIDKDCCVIEQNVK